MASPKRVEDRLLRRIAHLRTMLRHTEDDRIVVTVNEFIADTETRLIKLKPYPRRKIALH